MKKSEIEISKEELLRLLIDALAESGNGMDETLDRYLGRWAEDDYREAAVAALGRERRSAGWFTADESDEDQDCEGES